MELKQRRTSWRKPKGIDGVTEGTGNVAEDVGKVVEW